MKATYSGFDVRTYPQWLDVTNPETPRGLVAAPGGSYDVEPCSGLLDGYHAAQTAYDAAPADEKPPLPAAPTFPTDGLWQAADIPTDSARAPEKESAAATPPAAAGPPASTTSKAALKLPEGEDK